MSNPYGWSQPIDGQPAVYFAPPGEDIRLTKVDYSFSAADNGFGTYQSFIDQYDYRPHDPLKRSADASDPSQSLAARDARPGVSLIEATTLWLKNWNRFSGRASRSEYWWVRILQLVFQILWCVVFIGVMQMRALSPTDDVTNLLVAVALVVTCVVVLVLSVPTLSLTVRRLHDTNHSGWYYLVQFVPFGSLLVFRALVRGTDTAGYRFDDSTQPLYGPKDLV